MFRKVMFTAAIAVGLSSCTFAQIAQLEQMRGPITETDKVTLEALPDAPIIVGDQVIELDGTVSAIPEALLSPRARFDLAVSRTSWATRPDLHGWLTCVVRRESNFDPNAHNTRPPDNSYGYMQINMRGSLGPARMAQHGLSAYEDLFVPETNLEAGWQLFQAAGTSPWKATRGGC